MQNNFTFAKLLKSANPPPNDSLPNTVAKGSKTQTRISLEYDQNKL